VNAEIISIDPHDKAIIARVTLAELSHDTTLQFKSAMRSAFETGPGRPVVVDMSAVEFLPSIALGALVELHLDLKRSGRRLAVIGLRPAIADLVKLSGLDNLLEIYQQLDAALAQA